MINKLNFSNVLLNTISIGSFQFANYFLPILMVPFLIRALGLDLYGSFAILYAILSFLNLMVEYGFNVLATKEVALMQNKESKVSQYFSNVIFTKLSIFILIVLFSFVCQISLLLFLLIPLLIFYIIKDYAKVLKYTKYSLLCFSFIQFTQSNTHEKTPKRRKQQLCRAYYSLKANSVIQASFSLF